VRNAEVFMSQEYRAVRLQTKASFSDYILFVFALLIFVFAGCGVKKEMSSSQYPISDQYGRQTLASYSIKHCGGVYNQACELSYQRFFSQKLIEYYGKTAMAVRICSDNNYICRQDHFFEDFVKHYGQI